MHLEDVYDLFKMIFNKYKNKNCYKIKDNYKFLN